MLKNRKKNSDKKSDTQATPTRIAIALQGGGSWGAFGWGVLDRLLEEDGIEITDISGTSAGAMSGSIVAHAINSSASYNDGRQRARNDLGEFWRHVCDSNHGLMSVLSGGFAGLTDPVKNPNLPALHWIQASKTWMDMGSVPGPFSLSDNFNAVVEKMSAARLRQIVRRAIPSFDKIRSGKNLKLHVNATKQTDQGLENVVFSGRRLSIDKVLASSTLRGLFKPVQIDGDDYYDGAYCENPSIDPLLKRYNGGSKKSKKDKPFDAMLWIMMNPPKDSLTPRPQSGLSHQDLEKTSGLVLHQAYDQMALYALQNEDLGANSIPPQHCIWFNAPSHYDQTSKQNTEAAFLLHLYEEGRKSADAFLKKHKADLAHKTTVDLNALEREGLKRSGKTIKQAPFRMRYKR